MSAFKMSDRREYEPTEHGSERRDSDLPNSDRQADRGRKPYASGRCKAKNNVFIFTLEDGSCTQKADTGDSAVNDAREVGDIHSSALGSGYQQRGPRSDQHMGTQPGIFACDLALVTDDRAKQGRNCQPKAEADQIPLVKHSRLQFLKQHFHRRTLRLHPVLRLRPRGAVRRALDGVSSVSGTDTWQASARWSGRLWQSPAASLCKG